MGPVIYGENESEIFLGRSVTSTKHVSEATMQKIDDTIRKILEAQYNLATKLLTDNRAKVEMMAQMLLEKETIDAKDIDMIMASQAAVVPPVTLATDSN
jgi:cell division protease FtsH